MSAGNRILELSEPQQYILESPYEINLFMGGTGSGKTFLEGVLSASFVRNYPDVIGLIGANTYEQLNTSTLKGIRDVWKVHFGLLEDVHYVAGKAPPKDFDTSGHNFDRYDSIISFRNGAVIYKVSLDNYKVHEGKELGWAMLDETKDTREEAIKEVILHRLRQKGILINGEYVNPMYIGTTPAKVDWINEWFRLDEHIDDIQSKIYDKKDYYFQEGDGKCAVICSIYHNETNLVKGYIDKLVREHTTRDGKLNQAGRRLIYADPFMKAGGEFYSSFDRSVHVAAAPYLAGEPIHITYDFNVVPYMTITCWQVIQRKGYWEVRCFDELCLPSPDNTTERATREFLRRHESKCRFGLFYYGDPSGNARSTRGRSNDFDIIEEILRPYLANYSRRVPSKAPPVIERRDFANNIFDEIYDIRIIIDPRCLKVIADFEYLKEDADGKKMKTRVTDPDTKQPYEKYGHTSDSFDMFITQAFESHFKKW